MMHGMEKSDSVIVAEKSANKGTPVPAESMEPRAEPKGNPEGQSTRRAQDRGSVSQAADRIRQFVQTGATGASDGASPPCHGRCVALGLLRTEERRCGRRGRHNVADVLAQAGDPTPMAEPTIRRHCNPREESRALAGMRGSVRGALRNQRPYRDTSGRWSYAGRRTGALSAPRGPCTRNPDSKCKETGWAS